MQYAYICIYNHIYIYFLTICVPFPVYCQSDKHWVVMHDATVGGVPNSWRHHRSSTGITSPVDALTHGSALTSALLALSSRTSVFKSAAWYFVLRNQIATSQVPIQLSWYLSRWVVLPAQKCKYRSAVIRHLAFAPIALESHGLVQSKSAIKCHKSLGFHSCNGGTKHKPMQSMHQGRKKLANPNSANWNFRIVGMTFVEVFLSKASSIGIETMEEHEITHLRCPIAQVLAKSIMQWWPF